jgi:chromosome segregation ATPase
LLSALILKARDQIAELKSRANTQRADSFWPQFEALVSRHEAQMDKCSDRAASIRARLASSRKSGSSAHLQRMEEARSQLALLTRDLESTKRERDADQVRKLQNDKKELQAELDACETEIQELTQAIPRRRQVTMKLKENLETRRAELDSESDSAKNRTQLAESRIRDLTSGIRSTASLLVKLDAELSNLESREAACAELYESLQEPIPVIQRIFSKF